MRWILGALVTVAVAGCGADAERTSERAAAPASAQELAVRAAVEGYYAAVRGEDVAGVCLILAGDRTMQECGDDVRADLDAWSDAVFEQRPKITSIRVRGDRAQANLAPDIAGQPSLPAELVREGGRWKIVQAGMPGSAGSRAYVACVVNGLDGMVEERAWREYGPVAINEFTRRYCVHRVKEPNLSDARHEEISHAIILDMCRNGRLPARAADRLT